MQNRKKIDVTFEIDLDGILKVSAKDKLTKENKSIEIRNSLNMTNEEIEDYRRIALLMCDEDVKRTIYSEKVKELKTWKNVYDEINSPELSSNDYYIIDKVENCIQNIHKSNEDPEFLIDSLKNIIENQDYFAA